jgi:hypothetical protein
MKKIKMIQNVPVSPDGLRTETWNIGEIRDVNDVMAKSFVEAKLAVEYQPEIIAHNKPKIEVKKVEIEEKEKPKKNGKRGRPRGIKNIKNSPTNKAFANTPEDK